MRAGRSGGTPAAPAETPQVVAAEPHADSPPAPEALRLLETPPVHVLARPPRVLHLITRLIRGGADENTMLTAEGLGHLGYDCTIACGGESDPRQVARVHGAATCMIPSLVRPIDPFRDVAALAGTIACIRRLRPDIVHTHTAKAGVIGRMAARLTRVPIVIHGLHGTTFHDGQGRLSRAAVVATERLLAPATSTFMSVSDDLSELYLAAGIGRREQYTTVRSGMPLDEFKAVAGWTEEQVRAKRTELNLPPNLPVALLVSRLEPRKRIERFIEAAAHLREQGVQASFAVAGEGPQRAELEQLIAARGLSDCFHLLGFRNDIAEVLAAASAVCLTSGWEGLPRVFVQSTVVGRQVVCFDVNGAREVITDGVNGYVIPPDDPESFCQRLRQVLEDREATGRCFSHCGSDPVERWTVESMVNDTAKVYARLLHEAGYASRLHIPVPG